MRPGRPFYGWQPLVLLHIELFVHLLDLPFGGRAKHLDNLLELVDLGVAHEGGSAVDHLNQDAAGGPHVDLGGVVSCTEDKFGGPVAARADVGEVGLG